jgi:serine-type D-Ala-D-Ala carboxypeptidase/endopeptidase
VTRSKTFALLSALALFVGVNAQAGDMPAPADKTDSMIQKYGQAFVEAGNSDGLSIAVVVHGRTRFYNFGTTVRGKAQLPTQDTVYEIGSVTKTFTSLLLAQALVAKKADGSDDIRRYLPGKYPGLAYQGTPITLTELAATTSALPDNIPDFMGLVKTEGLEKAPGAIMQMLKPYSQAKLLADLQGVSLSSKPGAAPAHSNVAPEVLGIILERLYGRTYADLVAQYIEQPLGMKSGVAKERLAQMASGYMAGDAPTPLISTLNFILPAGGLRYSASDMAKYAAYQVSSSHDPAVALTHQPAWGDPDQDAVGFNWTIKNMPGGGKRLSQSGGTFGFSSFVDLYPASHCGIVLLANRSGPMTQDQLADLSYKIMHEL